MRCRAGVSLLWFVMPNLGKVSAAAALENFRCRSFDVPVKTCHSQAPPAGIFGRTRFKLQLLHTVTILQVINEGVYVIGILLLIDAYSLEEICHSFELIIKTYQL